MYANPPIVISFEEVSFFNIPSKFHFDFVAMEIIKIIIIKNSKINLDPKDKKVIGEFDKAGIYKYSPFYNRHNDYGVEIKKINEKELKKMSDDILAFLKESKAMLNYAGT